ncbi:PEP-CTERM motif protein [Geobacter sp. OR-1]|uniref:PEP-CTERM sorting domain-containing protein n=1 Tax=Geobacter sp. OR-1 TaxID=1266765 RepID=UPI000541FF7C|nr:PEP-CTERM sorting domain-containing protein [Geobacter sp. OR-1]GAM08110.1 PEP-CTERM motif protein [Geobacter sp. OR-1]
MFKKIARIIAASSAALLISSTAFATSWIDWNGSTGTGTLTIGSDIINVSLAGMAGAYVQGDYYYNNGSTGGISPSGTYAGLKPFDMVQEWGTGSVTLTFSKAIVDPYIALVSVGQGGLPVSYAFTNSQGTIDVISYGPNYWGYTGYTVNGNIFTGREYNGILQLDGAYTSLSFDIRPNEFWHGFNIGSNSTSAPVPEPSTIILLGAGLAGLGLARRKFRK